MKKFLLVAILFGIHVGLNLAEVRLSHASSDLVNIQTVVTYEDPPPLVIEGCGDGKVQAYLGEECDDGNSTDDGNGCSSTCKSYLISIPPPTLVSGGYCGDGKTQPDLGELCDDGNKINDDVCDNTCMVNPVSIVVDPSDSIPDSPTTPQDDSSPARGPLQLSGDGSMGCQLQGSISTHTVGDWLALSLAGLGFLGGMFRKRK